MDYLGHFGREVAAFAAAGRAAVRCEAAPAVPSCPGWVLAADAGDRGRRPPVGRPERDGASGAYRRGTCRRRDWANIRGHGTHAECSVEGAARARRAVLVPADRRAGAFERWLREVEAGFAERIIPVTLRIAAEWGRQRHEQPIPVIDALIAATAKVHGWIVVTRNAKDIERGGAQVHNPFVD